MIILYSGYLKKVFNIISSTYPQCFQHTVESMNVNNVNIKKQAFT